MDRSVQALVAIAAAAVIAVAGLYFWNNFQQKAEAQRLSDEAKAVADAADLRDQALDCLPLVVAYDKGDHAPARKKYGSLSEEAVAACRALISIAREEGLIPS